jgi:hypothetical protein
LQDRLLHGTGGSGVAGADSGKQLDEAVAAAVEQARAEAEAEAEEQMEDLLACLGMLQWSSANIMLPLVYRLGERTIWRYVLSRTGAQAASSRNQHGLTI